MTLPHSLSTIILAAGKGTRMKSEKAKVLHELFFAPMIHHVLNALSPLKIEKNVVVVGHQRDKVMSALSDFSLEYTIQEDQLGTGHAALCAEDAVHGSDTVMILCGDTPLIQAETLAAMYDQHKHSDSVLTVMTTVLDDPSNYGRIITGNDGNVLSIIEEKDASSEVKEIKEINAGIYCVDSSFLFQALKEVGTDNKQGEVYLTDIVGIAVSKGNKVRNFINPFPEDILGVNSRVELAQADKELQMRYNRHLMLQGVTMYSPETILITPSVTIGRDSIIHSGVRITGNTTISENVVIEQGAILHSCSLEEGARIGANSYLSKVSITKDMYLAPFSQNTNI